MITLSHILKRLTAICLRWGCQAGQTPVIPIIRLASIIVNVLTALLLTTTAESGKVITWSRVCFKNFTRRFFFYSKNTAVFPTELDCCCNGIREEALWNSA